MNHLISSENEPQASQVKGFRTRTSRSGTETRLSRAPGAAGSCAGTICGGRVELRQVRVLLRIGGRCMRYIRRRRPPSRLISAGGAARLSVSAAAGSSGAAGLGVARPGPRERAPCACDAVFFLSSALLPPRPPLAGRSSLALISHSDLRPKGPGGPSLASWGKPPFLKPLSVLNKGRSRASERSPSGPGVGGVRAALSNQTGRMHLSGPQQTDWGLWGGACCPRKRRHGAGNTQGRPRTAPSKWGVQEGSFVGWEVPKFSPVAGGAAGRAGLSPKGP